MRAKPLDEASLPEAIDFLRRHEDYTIGTQGIVRSRSSGTILLSSFVVAEATRARLLRLCPAKVSFVITGSDDGDEDLALADYLESLICGKEAIDAQPFLHRVVTSKLGSRFASSDCSHFPMADLHAATAIDRFDFAMQVFEEDKQLVVRQVNAQGEKLMIEHQGEEQ